MPRKSPPETPLYVKLPQAAVDKLDRAVEQLGLPKKDIVAGLLTKYLEPVQVSATVGSYSFRAYDPPEIMNAEQAGQFLQIDERNVIELAEAGKLPGKKLGPAWRFAREALVAWLSTPDTDSKERKR